VAQAVPPGDPARFEENVYGRSPARPKNETSEVLDLDKRALNGRVVRKQARVTFSAVHSDLH